MSTIVDVSKLAGVSKATVSRVINDSCSVKESTRQRVLSAMEQLGFRPNTVARALATNETNTIGFVVSDFDGTHFGSLLKQASASAEKAKKQLLVTDGHNDPDIEYELIRKLEASCDAIVLYSRTLSDEHIEKLTQQLSIPLVVMNRLSANPFYHVVSFDQTNSVEMMVEYLVSQGHSKIACITGTMDNPTGIARFEGYRRALENNKLRFDPELVEQGDYLIVNGYKACQRLLKKGVHFSAIVAFNDHMALGAIKACLQSGIEVPNQVSIVGIDNDIVCEFSTPTLTTIELPIEKMTEHAIQLALLLTKEPAYADFHQYSGRLINRQSVARLQK